MRHWMGLLAAVVAWTALSPAARAAPAASASAVYRVQPGDTLYRIARRHGTTPERLAAYNGIQVTGILAIGQRLRVPPVAGARSGPGATPRRLAGGPASRGEAWTASLVAVSRRYLGVRYRWGGTDPSGFDCSGFLYFVFGRLGVTLPRTTYAMFEAGTPVPREELAAGDLVFFETVSPGPSHAGIYLGDGRFIHAASGSGRVLITDLAHDYYAPRYLGARRY